MDRIIKFRGQTRRKGEKVKLNGTPIESNWVYGGILFGNGDFSVIYTSGPIDKVPVYTDTVGQYTGLKDIRGRDLFEGDIVQWGVSSNVIGEICWMDIEGIGFFLKVNGIGFYPIDGKCHLELLGNIHDNPELIDRRG